MKKYTKIQKLNVLRKVSKADINEERIRLSLTANEIEKLLQNADNVKFKSLGSAASKNGPEKEAVGVVLLSGQIKHLLTIECGVSKENLESFLQMQNGPEKNKFFVENVIGEVNDCMLNSSLSLEELRDFCPVFYEKALENNESFIKSCFRRTCLTLVADVLAVVVSAAAITGVIYHCSKDIRAAEDKFFGKAAITREVE